MDQRFEEEGGTDRLSGRQNSKTMQINVNVWVNSLVAVADGKEVGTTWV